MDKRREHRTPWEHAYSAGEQHRADGGAPDDNPHMPGTERWAGWAEGYGPHGMRTVAEWNEP